MRADHRELRPALRGRSVRVSALAGLVALLMAVVGMVVVVPTSAVAAPAPTLTVAGTAVATNAAGASVAVGDVFTWSLTLDLGSPSTSSTASYGNTFNAAVLDFSVAASDDNVGTCGTRRGSRGRSIRCSTSSRTRTGTA
jgi:hypothetical protein